MSNLQIIFDYSIYFDAEVHSDKFVDEFNKQLKKNSEKTLTLLGIESVSFGEPGNHISVPTYIPMLKLVFVDCSEWPSSISPYLSLIKLLPTTAGRNKKTRDTFSRQVDGFIVLKTVIYSKFFIGNQSE